MMSSELREPKRVADHSSTRSPEASSWPQAPVSIDLDATCSRGGSEMKALGRRHGSSGSAQLNSAAVGKRLDSP